MMLTEELRSLVAKLEAEEHHLAAEARAVYEKLHAEIVKAAHALTGRVPDPAPPAQSEAAPVQTDGAPAEPPKRG